MRLFFILAVIGISSCAKLDLLRLSPSQEKSPGVDFFIEPEFDATGFDENSFGFVQDSIDITENKNDLDQPLENSAQKEIDIAQQTNSYDQNQNPFTQNYNSNTRKNIIQPDNADPQYVDTFDHSDHVEKVKSFSRNDYLNEDLKPDQAQVNFERLARILRLDTENNGEVFSYSYKTQNDMSSSAQGVSNNGVEFKGGFSYTGDDGKVYSIRYTSDENELRARGDDLPTPPPLSRAIRKALAQNEQDEFNGIYDDAGVIYPGKYHHGKYANSEVETSRFNNYAYGNDMFGIGNNGNGFVDNNYNFNGFNPESDETEESAITKKTHVPTSFDQNDDDSSSSIVTITHHFPSNNQRFQFKSQKINDRNGNKNYGAGDETIPLFRSFPASENQRLALRKRKPNQNGNINLDIKEDLYSINNDYVPQDDNQQFVLRNQVPNNNKNINENIPLGDDTGSINDAYFPTHESQEFINQIPKYRIFKTKDNSVLTNNAYIRPLGSSDLSTRNQKLSNQNPYGNKEDVTCIRKGYLPPINDPKAASAYQRQERIHQSLGKMVAFDQELETFIPYRDRSRGNLRFNKDGGPQIASNPGFRSDPALNFGGRSARKSKKTEITSTEKTEEDQNDYDSSLEY